MATMMPIIPSPDQRTFDHLVLEFAQEVQFMAEQEKISPPNVGDLVAAMTRELQKQVRARPHGLIYANMAALIAVIFWSGVLYQRVNELDSRVRAMATQESMASIQQGQQELRDDFKTLQDRIDRFLDNPSRPR